jgi:hypothetical protein
MTDLNAAAQFIAGHARLLERRRFAIVEQDGLVSNVLAALLAYRNADGGFGHLEPDLRTPASQPSCLLYALEILHEVGLTEPDLVASGLDWLQGITHDDGGVPFVTADAAGWPHAPWWQPEPDPPSSLLMTAGIAAMAHRLAPGHPWTEAATAYCWKQISTGADTDPYTVRYLIDFLDAVPDRDRATAALGELARLIPGSGVLRVQAGTEGELLRPLELVPRPDHAGRALFRDDAIERELDRLATEQQPDGGWTFSWANWNPVASWEWRGVVTVQALRTLRAYGRLV